MKILKKIFILFVIHFAIHGQVFSQNESVSWAGEIEAALDAEIEWLQEEAIVMTEIATKTKMDANLVPGMVTVLNSDDLKNKGIRTVYEALSLVPGLNTSINTIGDKIISVRGIGGNFFSGNLKIMLDGIVLNDTLSAAGYVLYEIPVEQVDRIEIIRGPGSVIYGEYAYAGVVNVITRKTGNRVFARYGSYDSYGGGGTVSYELPEKEFSLNLNFSGWESDGSDAEAGKDRLHEGIFGGMDLSDFSNAPGPTNESQRDRFANLNLKYKGFSLEGQYISHQKGDYYGMIHVLPPEDDRLILSHEHIALEARYNLNFSDGFNLDLKSGGRQYEYDVDNLIGMPPMTNIPLPDGTTFDITPPDGSLAAPHYEERECYAGAEFIWKGIKQHTFLLGIKYSDIEMGDVWVNANTTDEKPGEIVRVPGNWLAENVNRRVISLYFQDMFEISEPFTITLGLRYDKYNDMGESLTPRISAVYRLADHHIFKAQYSEAVRPPSFTELYSRGNTLIAGNENLESERIRSGELGYIYKRAKTVGRVTLFYSQMEENIEYPEYAETISGDLIQYQNAEDTIHTRGFEVEFEQGLKYNLKLNANLSFADTEDEKGKPLSGATDWLGNIGMTYEPHQDYLFAFQYRYVGKRHRSADDERDALSDYDTLDFTANIYNLLTKGLTLRAGIKNLFDSDVVYPAPVFKDSEGNIGYYYPDDFLRSGREWWIQVSYDFD